MLARRGKLFRPAKRGRLSRTCGRVRSRPDHTRRRSGTERKRLQLPGYGCPIGPGLNDDPPGVGQHGGGGAKLRLSSPQRRRQLQPVGRSKVKAAMAMTIRRIMAVAPSVCGPSVGSGVKVAGDPRGPRTNCPQPTHWIFKCRAGLRAARRRLERNRHVSRPTRAVVPVAPSAAACEDRQPFAVAQVTQGRFPRNADERVEIR